MNKNNFNECAKRLKECREENHFTLEEIGNKINVHKSTVLRWENGETGKISTNVLKLLADLYNVNVVWLMGYDVPKKIINMRSKHVVKIPVVGTVAAGEPILAEQNIVDYEELPAEEFKDGDYFGLKIKGDSMLPRILEDDVVIVRQQNDCDNGQVAVVLINGDEATVKQIKKTENGIMLIPFNNKYDPMFFTKEEIETKPVRIIGVIKRLIGYNFK